MSFQNAKACCIYDTYEVNNIYNQIIKSTILKLISLKDLNSNLKRRLKNILQYFKQIDTINVNNKIFKNLRFDKNNRYYYLMIKICELINDNLILSDEEGIYKFINLFDDESNFDEVFEKFINRFYKKSFKDKYEVHYQKKIHWNFDNGSKEMLPIMQLDTTLVSKEETIIIDTKYYKKFYRINKFNQKKFINEHLFQMQSYLNNYNCDNNLRRGIILYPMPQTGETVDEIFEFNIIKNNNISPSSIKIVTIDLSKKWQEIENDLIKIIN